MKYIISKATKGIKETEVTRKEALKLLKNHFNEKYAKIVLDELENGRMKDGVILTFTKLFIRK